jgi:threonine/homoserine/homoserine lactone efflux protein
MPVTSIAAFWAVATLLIVVPGADWAFVIGAVTRGHPVVPAVGGLVLGYTGITAVVAAGVGAAVAGSPAILTGLTVVGGLYLTWHGAMTFAHPSTPTVAGATAGGAAEAAGGCRGVLVKGIGVSGLNPKGLLILLALLPQFTRPHQSLPVAGQIGVLGLVFTVSVAIFYLLLGSFARKILDTRPAATRVLSRVAGIGMVIIGVLLIIQRLTA